MRYPEPFPAEEHLSAPEPLTCARMNRQDFLIQLWSGYLSREYLCAASGGQPCRVIAISYRRALNIHGGNSGSNPVGGANIPTHLQIPGRCGFSRHYSRMRSLDRLHFLRSMCVCSYRPGSESRFRSWDCL